MHERPKPNVLQLSCRGLHAQIQELTCSNSSPIFSDGNRLYYASICGEEQDYGI